jgi:hypothetical protein
MAAEQDWQGRARAMARALLDIADAAGMPDTYWQTDLRIAMARDVLGVPADGRYTHARLWDGTDEGSGDG